MEQRVANHNFLAVKRWDLRDAFQPSLSARPIYPQSLASLAPTPNYIRFRTIHALELH